MYSGSLIQHGWSRGRVSGSCGLRSDTAASSNSCGIPAQPAVAYGTWRPCGPPDHSVSSDSLRQCRTTGRRRRIGRRCSAARRTPFGAAAPDALPNAHGIVLARNGLVVARPCVPRRAWTAFEPYGKLSRSCRHSAEPRKGRHRHRALGHAADSDIGISPDADSAGRSPVDDGEDAASRGRQHHLVAGMVMEV
jgi:hypothetical protein